MAQALLDWYDKNARVLPWRSVPTSYRVWVSEIMLQQTQVETVLPYFDRFMARFPDVASLARAEQAEVLKIWEGLGYYGRARSLHKAARILVEKYEGQLPCSIEELRKLAGIGRYTAGAIASIAYGMAEPALDGNIRRVYARLLNSDEALGTPASESALWSAASENLDRDRPGDFNQALMDLGARICRPSKPDCPACPLREICQAYMLGRQDFLPVKVRKPAVPHYEVTAAVIQQNGKILVAQRQQGGLLGGLWEFPGGKLEEKDADLAAGLRREILEELGARVEVKEAFGVYKHAYTHYKITLHAFLCQLEDGEKLPLREDVRMVLPAELEGYPMGKVDRLIANHLMEGTDEK